MTQGTSKPSKQQAHNFHVMPKDQPQPAASPADSVAGNADQAGPLAERDPEAGSVLGEVNQSPAAPGEARRSQVS